MSIQSEINRIAGAKSDIADAIEAQGVTVPSGTKLDGMANLIGQISGGSAKLNSTQAADAYDPTATYAVGDKVSYAGNVYSCISAISTPEAWDSTHWDQVDPIQDQIDDVRNTLNQIVSPNAGSHNSIYRGKNLGSSVTAAQYAEIDAGTFDDLFIGDYWVIGGVNYRIAAFDYWLNTGDGSRCQTHHVVIVPDSSLTSGKMNNSNVTTGAYIGSDFYTGAKSNTARATAQSTVRNAFGSAHILSHREYLVNAVTNGYESGQSIYDVEIELMNELMVYGSNIFHNIQNGTNLPSNYTMSKSQLPLFQHRHDLIGNGDSWWLRDVISSARFAFVYSDGDADHGNASYSVGIRPAFAIKA